MSIVDRIKNRAKLKKMTIILPEAMDSRVLKAALKILKENIANIILIGDSSEIRKVNGDIDFSNLTIINPDTCEYTDLLIEKFYNLRKHRGLTKEQAREILLSDYMYYACMLVKCNYADGVVSGACHPSANTFKPALQIIGAKDKDSIVSAFTLMDIPNCTYGNNGVFLFADSGLVQNPTSLELVQIAETSAQSFKFLMECEPIVAMLSYSTKGSAKHPDVNKVRLATKMAKDRNPEYKIDGELQLDAAIIPEIAKFKAPDSEVAGLANVLIFPNLDAGNIGYKLVERFAKAKVYGPICQGLAKPVNDLSRGCTSDDIVGVVAITAIQAQNIN